LRSPLPFDDYKNIQPYKVYLGESLRAKKYIEVGVCICIYKVECLIWVSLLAVASDESVKK
jgi:hypothetical protein